MGVAGGACPGGPRDAGDGQAPGLCRGEIDFGGSGKKRGRVRAPRQDSTWPHALATGAPRSREPWAQRLPRPPTPGAPLRAPPPPPHPPQRRRNVGAGRAPWPRRPPRPTCPGHTPAIALPPPTPPPVPAPVPRSPAPSPEAAGLCPPQFVKVPRGVAPSVLFDLLLAEWRLPAPNLVVSLVGVERPFPMRSWLRDVLRKGLVKAAQSTGQAPAGSRAPERGARPTAPSPGPPRRVPAVGAAPGHVAERPRAPRSRVRPPRRVPATLRAEARPVHSQGPAASARCPGVLTASPPLRLPWGRPPAGQSLGQREGVGPVGAGMAVAQSAGLRTKAGAVQRGDDP